MGGDGLRYALALESITWDNANYMNCGMSWLLFTSLVALKKENDGLKAATSHSKLDMRSRRLLWKHLRRQIFFNDGHGCVENEA